MPARCTTSVFRAKGGHGDPPLRLEKEKGLCSTNKTRPSISPGFDAQPPEQATAQSADRSPAPRCYGSAQKAKGLKMGRRRERQVRPSSINSLSARCPKLVAATPSNGTCHPEHSEGSAFAPHLSPKSRFFTAFRMTCLAAAPNLLHQAPAITILFAVGFRPNRRIRRDL